MKKVERLARADGKKRIVLEARESNKQALKLYKSHGFEIIGKRKYTFRKKRIPYVMMAKELK